MTKPLTRPTRRKRCPTCGYDLRGAASPFCPECGTPMEWKRIRFFNVDEFTVARAVLNREGIVHRSINHSAGISALYFGHTPTSEIRFGPADEERVMQLLDDAGVAVPMPIVDRSEPVCPDCNDELDPDADETCPSCGLVFQWVEVDEPISDTTGNICVCGYNLTGVARDRCPECNTPIVFTELVEQAPGSSESRATLPREAWLAITVLATIAALTTLVLAAALTSRAAAFLAGLFGLVSLLCFKRTRQAEDEADRSTFGPAEVHRDNNPRD